MWRMMLLEGYKRRDRWMKGGGKERRPREEKGEDKGEAVVLSAYKGEKVARVGFGCVELFVLPDILPLDDLISGSCRTPATHTHHMLILIRPIYILLQTIRAWTHVQASRTKDSSSVL